MITILAVILFILFLLTTALALVLFFNFETGWGLGVSAVALVAFAGWVYQVDRFEEKGRVVRHRMSERGVPFVITNSKGYMLPHNVPMVKKVIVIDDGADVEYFEIILDGGDK